VNFFISPKGVGKAQKNIKEANVMCKTYLWWFKWIIWREVDCKEKYTTLIRTITLKMEIIHTLLHSYFETKTRTLKINR